MTARPTTLVESDQLAQAAVNILKNEDFVPKGKRWPFSRLSKAHKDYEKAVQDITARRRSAREKAIEETLKNELAEANATLERAKTSAETEHSGKIAVARKPYDETETTARLERDAKIATANLAYQQTVEAAHRVYQQAAAVLEQKREALVGQAKSVHADLHAAIEAKRKAALAQIERDLKTIPLEGLMRVVEDRQAWPVEDRKKALLGIVDLGGREDIDTEHVDLCLRNVAGYVFQDRFLPPDAQHHRLMDVSVLEAMVDLAGRTPRERPTIVKYIHEIVAQNPGHSSPALIKGLTALYVAASGDTDTTYAEDPIESEKAFDVMRDQIADALKLTPRRSQVPPPAIQPESVAAVSHDAPKASVPTKLSDAEITADVDVRDLVPLEAASAHAAEAEAVVVEPVAGKPPSTSQPPPMPRQRRVNRPPIPEGSS
jgi:hypothetical protein